MSQHQQDTLVLGSPTGGINQLEEWEEIAGRKRAQREEAIPRDWRLDPAVLEEIHRKPGANVISVPRDCGILSEAEVRITETDTKVLLQKMVSREYTSYEVTLAFCKRAAIAQQLTNCLSEIFFVRALDSARELDKAYDATGNPAGPLHGLPISMKDCFAIAGTDATVGYTANAFKPTEKDDESVMTEILTSCGAIPFCKTNVPLALMSGETYNDIYGYTSNPYNLDLSSGGSSGGEAALLALKGTPLGLGTDIGGSIRIPASYCGLYSLKPSFGRFPTLGIRDSFPGQESLRSVCGPLATSLADLEMWCEAVISKTPWVSADPDSLPLPWKKVVDVPKQLCIGLVMEAGPIKPLPPVTRALLETKSALEASGHIVIPFTIPDPGVTRELVMALYAQPGAKVIGDKLEETCQPWPPQGYKGWKQRSEDMRNDPSKVPTVNQLWETQVRRSAYLKGFSESWNATKDRTRTGREMDALLLPMTPGPACRKCAFRHCVYTSLANFVDYCATTLPVTTVDPVRDINPGYQPKTEDEASFWDGYDPEHDAGCPVGVQLIGRRLKEEYLLEITKQCQTALATQADNL